MQGSDRGHVRYTERGHVILILAREHDVAHIGLETIDDLRAQRADADPGARRELEVFGETAVEQQALSGLVRIFEF